MQLGERIKALRQECGLTQLQLSKKIGVSNVSLQYWESGARTPYISAVIALAKTFDVTVDYLLGVDIKQDEKDKELLTQEESLLLLNYRSLDRHGKDVVNAICQLEMTRIMDVNRNTDNVIKLSEQKPRRYIPRYTTPSAAGYSVPLDGDEFEMLIVDNTVPNDADFAVIIQGNSMAPYIKDGETVFVKRDCDLAIGDIGIFSVDGAMYCKQYYIDSEGNLTLVSANPELKDSNVYVMHDSTTSVECFGKVIMEHRISLPDYFL